MLEWAGGDGKMNEVEILEEIIKIQRKYLSVVESMGAITMSPQDKQRITFLETELKKIRGSDIIQQILNAQRPPRNPDDDDGLDLVGARRK